MTFILICVNILLQFMGQCHDTRGKRSFDPNILSLSEGMEGLQEKKRRVELR